ncbi:DUF1385 domain-containing protein [Candidatus Woesearchaeota archaeon]|nr:DUF1385 domain-containing protein [Candidatus Woesearchaeota archaeon]
MTKLIGGQAVIEGVMMKTERNMAVSVRLLNGKIKTKKEKLHRRKKWFRWPFIRGVVNLYDVLVLGIKTLTWSANQQLEEKEKLTNWQLAFTVFLSLGFGVLIFIVVPFFAASLFPVKGFWFNLVDGILRILILIGYLLLISLMSDVKLLFKYHGAEHKVVNCYEAGKKLDIKNVKKFDTLHPRCGTSFLVIVLGISILIFSFILGPWYFKLLGRIILLPFIASISYEVLRLGGRFKDRLFMKIINTPGMWIQKISTKEPTPKQIEVAITAFNAVLRMERFK